jgi:hypothetical protein
MNLSGVNMDMTTIYLWYVLLVLGIAVAAFWWGRDRSSVHRPKKQMAKSARSRSPAH